MKIDMTPMLSGKTDLIPLDYAFDLEEEIYGVRFPRPIRVKGEIKNSAGYMELRLTAEIEYQTDCARCLKEIDGVLPLEFCRGVADEETLVSEDNDDYILLEDGQLDIDRPLTEQILLEFPPKFLCKEDCKGLCPKCGIDLNESECSCVLKEPDPRFKVLLDYLEQHKDDENK